MITLLSEFPDLPGIADLARVHDDIQACIRVISSSFDLVAQRVLVLRLNVRNLLAEGLHQATTQTHQRQLS